MSTITTGGITLKGKLSNHFGVEVTPELASDICNLARKLKTQGINECSYPWANRPAYQQTCANTQALVPQLSDKLPAGLVLTHQTDPRGLALIIHPVGKEPGLPLDSVYEVAICK